MSEPLHVRLSNRMRAKEGVPQGDWLWLMQRLTPGQMDRIEAQAAEHGCDMLSCLRDWPELFANEDDE